MTRTSLVLRYCAFAVLATVANLGTQRLLLQHDPSQMSYMLAVLAGTLVGLVVKFLLDRRWIFTGIKSSDSMANQGHQFLLYSTTGIATTLIFWGCETAFWMLWQTHMAREAGAVLGLAIGYIAKYQLDRRFVFVPDKGLCA